VKYLEKRFANMNELFMDAGVVVLG